jgi:hypothetical protein
MNPTAVDHWKSELYPETLGSIIRCQFECGCTESPDNVFHLCLYHRGMEYGISVMSP